jgi:hypothetical protein
MFADFLSALRDGTEPRMTLEHARRDLQLVEQAYRTAFGPEWTSVRLHPHPADSP